MVVLTQSDPATLPVQVRIPCQNVFLNGELNIPSEANGVVIFVHGSSSSRNSPRNQFVASMIRDSGNGTLLFDLLTTNEEAEDNLTTHPRSSLPLLAERLAEVTRWLSSQPAMAELGIGYFGSSTGAAVALLAAVESEHKIDAVVSRGGRPDLAGSVLQRVCIPARLIVGGCDEATIRPNEMAFSMLRCEKELQIVPGATHLFEEPGALAKVGDLASDWFQRHLQRHPKSFS